MLFKEPDMLCEHVCFVLSVGRLQNYRCTICFVILVSYKSGRKNIFMFIYVLYVLVALFAIYSVHFQYIYGHFVCLDKITSFC